MVKFEWGVAAVFPGMVWEGHRALYRRNNVRSVVLLCYDFPLNVQVEATSFANAKRFVSGVLPRVVSSVAVLVEVERVWRSL